MLTHIPFTQLFKADHGWLKKSSFHFSYAEYLDRNNTHYGALRVMNDDFIAPHTGFDTHPHKDMEIVTYILRGELTYQDSMRNNERLGRGSMQYLSAGTGIRHTEHNEGDEEVHLIQIWILPSATGLTPEYESKIFTLEERQNFWLHLIGPKGTKGVTHISQDTNMYVSEVEKGKVLDFDLQKGRQLYIKVMEGSAEINGVTFVQGDAGKLSGVTLNVKALSDVHILLVEMQEIT
ncbi:MAG: cupin domain-containing protein [Sulfurovum sp.]|nr:cupin domain-containing protein [Sulfurovum sp.]